MALHIVPTNTPNTDDQVKNTDYAPAAPCASGVTDTLRSNGPVQVATMINNRHPIESRILNWDKTQYAMQMETRRRVHGLADPIKREMDLHMVQLSEGVSTINGNRIHSDMLLGKDWRVDWEDIYADDVTASPYKLSNDFHSVMENRLGL
ncbi:Proteasome maturation factor UMP1 [Pichia kudriavzevii]|uniref:Proteasome maturation factor UMP1 n=1 Tax=Pichia kudriavzevii TaxID=4909 RepID=A0A1V2LTI5_PICKU|nr:Proteasome maturation factor UMP1 [Pichia kudriavzevii]